MITARWWPRRSSADIRGRRRHGPNDLNIPAEEITYLAAGINHYAFYLRFEHKGEDLYPKLNAIAAAGTEPEWNKVRYEMLRRTGYFVTESSRYLQSSGGAFS